LLSKKGRWFSHLESILSVFEFFRWWRICKSRLGAHNWCVHGLLRHHLVEFGVGLWHEFLVFVSTLITVAVSPRTLLSR